MDKPPVFASSNSRQTQMWSGMNVSMLQHSVKAEETLTVKDGLTTLVVHLTMSVNNHSHAWGTLRNTLEQTGYRFQILPSHLMPCAIFNGNKVDEERHKNTIK